MNEAQETIVDPDEDLKRRIRQRRNERAGADTVTTETVETVEEEQETDCGPAPLLRIIGTFPTQEGKFETVQLELDNPGDEHGDRSAFQAWLTDFATGVIASMRRWGPATITVNDAHGTCRTTGEQEVSD